MGYLTTVSGVLGIKLWLLILILIWTAIWKLIALWTAARNNSKPWFIALAIINTVGILEIIYIFGISGCCKNKYSRTVKRSIRKK